MLDQLYKTLKELKQQYEASRQVSHAFLTFPIVVPLRLQWCSSGSEMVLQENRELAP